MDEIINFSDFLKDKETDQPKKENISTKSEIVELPNFNSNEIDSPIVIEEEEEIPMVKESISEPDQNIDNNKYKVFRDKSEIFTCNMEVEGVSFQNTKVRLILESGDWNLIFKGEIDSNGKVSIPIKKLSILEEGCTGSIKMEVVADDTVFVPWEDEFEVKTSKKVLVKFDEKISNKLTDKKPTIRIIK